MGRIKLTAKSLLLGNTLPLLAVFTALVSVIVLSGDFSFLTSRLLGISLLNRLTVTAFSLRMLKITLSVTGIVVSVLAVPGMSLGIERWFMLKAKGEAVRIRDIFYFFRISGFLRCQSAFWYSFFIRAGVFLFFQFPAICLYGVLYTAVLQVEAAYSVIASVMAAGLLLSFTGAAFYFVYSAGWLLYPFIIAADEALSPSEAYECSLGLVRERVGKICIFRLSFLPWWLLCIFVFPLFYVWGYYRQSLAVLAFEGINKKTVDS